MNTLKRIVKSICRFIVNILKLAPYLLRLTLKGRLTSPFKNKHEGKVAILANGPSLKDVLPNLDSTGFKDSDFVVLNFFAFEPVFWRIKPKHYCLADPMFFKANHRIDDVKRLFEEFKTIDWDMNIYVPINSQKRFIAFSGLSNTKINVIGLNTFPYYGFEKLMMFLYKKGLSMPIVQTVANMAIYLSINSGYSEINLYGVDHTFFDSLCVNNKNQLCNKDKHFYDNGDTQLKPIIRNGDDKIWKIADYLKAIARMFESHDWLAKYAEYMGVRVVNHTECSMIDSYARK